MSEKMPEADKLIDWKTCPICDGKGKQGDGSKCGRCGGTGKVPRK
jgi:DnaJ-class molecular chaperone